MKRTRDKELPFQRNDFAKEPNKKKRRLTLGQSGIMEVFYFNTSQYPTQEQYTSLANQLEIDKAKVKNWFHNKRSRGRKSGTIVQLNLDHFKSSAFWNRRIIFPCPPPKYKYSGELLFRMLALKATEALKRDIEMKTSSPKPTSFDFSSIGCKDFKGRTPLQNNGSLFSEQVVHCRGSFNGDCPIDDSIPDFKTLYYNLYSSDSYSSNPYLPDSYSSNPYSLDLHLEYINCLYPL